jgi:hypothetical protein
MQSQSRKKVEMAGQKLMLEVWEDFGESGEPLPNLCYAGPLGDGHRARLSPKARLLTTFEAGSHNEAMTIYYKLMGWGQYTTDQEWDYKPYPEEWPTDPTDRNNCS